MARNARGFSVPTLWPSATCWCAWGALALNAKNVAWSIESAAEVYLNAAANELYGARTVAIVNDGLGHAAVLRMYDRAIELAEAQS